MYYFGRGFYEIIASKTSLEIIALYANSMELKEVLEVIYTDGNILFVSLFFINSVDKTLKYFIHIHQIMLK